MSSERPKQCYICGVPTEKQEHYRKTIHFPGGQGWQSSWCKRYVCKPCEEQRTAEQMKGAGI